MARFAPAKILRTLITLSKDAHPVGQKELFRIALCLWYRYKSHCAFDLRLAWFSPLYSYEVGFRGNIFGMANVEIRPS